MENLVRYAHAGNQGGGRLSVKYIFTKENCGEDDVSGFTYAMLAIRPQKVWLTFDFDPVGGLSPESKDLGGYDYSAHVDGYAKTFLLLKKHGINAGHFTENHLAAISQHGKTLMELAHQRIKELSANEKKDLPSVYLENFRIEETVHKECSETVKTSKFSTKPLTIELPELGKRPWKLNGKRVLIAPVCHLSVELLKNQDIAQSDIIGFVDRDPVMQGKSIQGYKVNGYERISDLKPDVILVAAPEHHQSDIVKAASMNVNGGVQISIYEGDTRQRIFG